MLGDHDQMNVVGHEARADDGEPEASGLLRKEAEVDAMVVVDEEDVLSVIPALSHMVGHTRHDDAGDAGHAWTLGGAPGAVNK